MTVHDHYKFLLAPLRSVLSEGAGVAIHKPPDEASAPGSGNSFGQPLGTRHGSENPWTHVYAPLHAIMLELERRSVMVEAGPGDGFLGLTPTNRRFNRRSPDFWRIEDDLIPENGVMVDMIDIYRQLGVDVFSRMAEHCAIGAAGVDAA